MTSTKDIQWLKQCFDNAVDNPWELKYYEGLPDWKKESYLMYIVNRKTN